MTKELTTGFAGDQRDEIAKILTSIAKDGLPGPRDLDVVIDSIERICFSNDGYGKSTIRNLKQHANAISKELSLTAGTAQLLRTFVVQLAELHDANKNVQLGTGIDADLHDVLETSDQLVVIGHSIARTYQRYATAKHLANRNRSQHRKILSELRKPLRKPLGKIDEHQ